MGGLDEDGEGGGGFHLTQEGLPPVGEAQDAEVGQSRRAVCGGQAQEGPEDQAADAGQRVALGLDLAVEFVQGRGGLDGGRETVAQALAAVREAGEVRLVHPPQAGQDGAGAVGEVGRVGPQELLCVVGEIGGEVLVTRQEFFAEIGGGGVGLVSLRLVVVGPQAGDGVGRELGPQGADGEQILHTQVVVGLAQAVRSASQEGRGGGLAGGGEGQALVQRPAQLCLPGGTVETVGCLLEGGQVSGLTAEAEDVYHPRGRQQAHAAPRKGLGGGGRPEGGQLKHQVHPLGQGERGAGPLVRQGRLAPLDPVSAHGTDDGAVCAEGPADGLDVVAVAAVKGIVLCDDTDCRHDPTSWVKKFEIRGFNACPFGQNGI